jgi:allantoinase
MTSVELTLHSRRVVTPDGVREAVVAVAGGRILSVTPAGGAPRGAEHLDLGDLALLPGLVDTHVHVNEPGRTEWEGYESATRAAAAGGVTTIVDMPLNGIPPTVDVAALEARRAAAAGAAHVDVAFWGGVVPGNAGALEHLARAGVRGFKCFLAPSGVPEFPHVGERDLREAMPVIARLGLPLLAHAEDPAVLDAAVVGASRADPTRHAAWLASRPPAAEVRAIELLVRLCGEFRCRVHVVHLSAAEALPALSAARARGLPLTVESCPHYLDFAHEEIARGATAFKCAPPIRPLANRERLWEALADGAIDLIASDHSPCPPALKHLERGDFLAAWGGIASLELGLAAVWSGARLRGHGLADLARWMSDRPARLAGFAGRKGAIAPGADADLLVWDPDAEFVVDAGRLHQRHPVTPWAGRRLTGRVDRVLLRGATIYGAGSSPAAAAGLCL